MTDKTSTAPVMSDENRLVAVRYRDLHDLLDANLAAADQALALTGGIDSIEENGGPESDEPMDRVAYSLFYGLFPAKRLRDQADLNATASDVVDGDVVACRYRVVAPNGNVGKWFFTDEACVSSGCLEVQPLYAAPRVQGDASVTPLSDEVGEPIAQKLDKALTDLCNAVEDIETGKHPSAIFSFLRSVREYVTDVREDIVALAAQPKGDVLDAPALVGNTIFDRGTKCSNVIARAQLAYKHKDDVMPPEQVAEMRAALDRARGTQAPIAASHPAEQTRGDGVAAIPSSFLISKKALEGIHYMCGGDEEGAEIDDRWCEGMAWIGNLENGDGTSTYGLHLHNADYPEEGSITIAQFVERDALRQAVPDGVTKDAARYRWWRDNIERVSKDWDGVRGVSYAMGLDICRDYSATQGQIADAVADAAIAAAPSAGRMGVES
ncbi:hypothetical protein GCM10009552_15480 [Rothia nasimurium]|uniref:Uncharacterized protein n=1 Tax=Luteibacter anthropi TaxID=564369 RepID=A0A7X5UB51_9GAMM|nr:hypothetical protein [Luteibacter anthropi]NII07213.1 hypothetical protein [Luteibacter anthropi]